MLDERQGDDQHASSRQRGEHQKHRGQRKRSHPGTMQRGERLQRRPKLAHAAQRVRIAQALCDRPPFADPPRIAQCGQRGCGYRDRTQRGARPRTTHHDALRRDSGATDSERRQTNDETAVQIRP